MPKLFESSHAFPAPWSGVTLAAWLKYPNNHTPHVIHVDILDRHVDPRTGILRTERLITCKQSVPAFIRKFIGGDDVSYVREISEVDPKTQRMTLVSKNLSYSQYMTIEETCSYTPDHSNANHTLFNQEAKITAFGFLSAIANKIEDFSLNSFRANSSKGKLGLQEVIDRIGLRADDDLQAA